MTTPTTQPTGTTPAPISRETAFERSATALLGALQAGEDLILNYSGEEVDYIRFNKAALRQATRVDEGTLELRLTDGKRMVSGSCQLTHGADEAHRLIRLLETLRKEMKSLPEDPFVVRPVAGESSREVHRGRLCDGETFVRDVLVPSSGLDVVGVHQIGTSYRGVAHSKGLRHWFETDGFATDYSIFHRNGKAVKGTFAGKDWNGAAASTKLKKQAEILERLGREPMRLKPGRYDVYLEPSAVADLVGMLSYDAVSESCMRQGSSALIGLLEGRKKLSPLFSVAEDFSQGLVPRFNDFGELAQSRMGIFEKGALTHTLISPRTAAEHGLVSNGANSSEDLRTPVVAPGTLDASKALEQLGTGLYIPNLHYLNWSDRQGARVTGMTRYACMWVENGELVAPIVDMRFDESLFDCFGESLEACTQDVELVPSTGSYDGKQLGGIVAPGMLIRRFSFTL